MNHNEKLREQAYLKVDYIAEVLRTYNFNSIILLDCHSADFPGPMLNREAIALKGQRNHNINFCKKFDSFKQF